MQKRNQKAKIFNAFLVCFETAEMTFSSDQTGIRAFVLISLFCDNLPISEHIYGEQQNQIRTGLNFLTGALLTRKLFALAKNFFVT